MAKQAEEEKTVSNKKKQWIQGATLCLIAYDIIAVNAAYFLALWIRFDCQFIHSLEHGMNLGQCTVRTGYHGNSIVAVLIGLL